MIIKYIWYFPFYILLLITGCSNDSGLKKATTPYPYSKDIIGIEWYKKSHKHFAPGSDNWPTTWADDGFLYTAWGDGGGFNGTNTKGRVSLGVAKITGNIENYYGSNLWGGFDSLYPATFKGKSYGMLSVDGILYMALFSQEKVDPYKVGQIAYSKNKGKSFEIGFSFNEPDAAFSTLTFLNFGKDYKGARDEFVYLYSGQPLNGCIDRCIGYDYFLARVPKMSILKKEAYRFFSGIDTNGEPIWKKDIKGRKPIFSDRNGASVRFGVIYHPKLKKYLLSNSHNNNGGLGIFESSEPWGPWHTIVYFDNWLNFGYSPSYHIAAQKWMSEDGSLITMVFSSKDQWNTIQGSLITRDLKE